MWLTLVVILLALTLCLRKLNENYYVLCLCKRIRTADGSRLEDKVCTVPGVVPCFGNNFDMSKLTAATIFQYVRKCILYSKGRSYLWYFLRTPIYNIATADDAIELAQSTTILDKSILYNLVKPFLGEGLLVSTDHKWHARRKLLTPAFHFKVLESFNEVFKEQSLQLLKKLENLQNDNIAVKEIIENFTLNNIIETALGVKLDDSSGCTQYLKIIHDIEMILVERIINPFMVYDIVFRLFGRYKKHMEDLKIAHDFSSRIIEKKRKEYRQKQAMENQKVDETEDFGQKKRYAMLDTLLAEEAKGNIDHQGICEEVNTFLFGGYDTTASGLTYALLNLSLYSEVQDKCRQEIEQLGDFSSLTVFDFNRLQYLECFIKETLRLYPSAPFVGRTCRVETRLNGLVLPRGCQILLQIYDIMRDPNVFPEPTVFKPERFLSENSTNRHPLAFMAFSAGSRNCIGQKFGILEMKVALVALLRNFQILPVTKLEDLVFEYGIILRTQQKICVKLKKI